MIKLFPIGQLVLTKNFGANTYGHSELTAADMSKKKLFVNISSANTFPHLLMCANEVDFSVPCMPFIHIATLRHCDIACGNMEIF